MPQDNLQIVQAAYDAFGRGDIAGILSLVADEVDWEVLGPAVIPFAGPRRGKAGVGLFFQQLSDCFDVEVFELDQFVVQDATVVVLGHERMKSKKTGMSHSGQWAHVHTIAGGKIARFREYTDSAGVAAVLGIQE